MLSQLPLLVVVALASMPLPEAEARGAAHEPHTAAHRAPTPRIHLAVGASVVSGALVLGSVGYALTLLHDAPERVPEAVAIGVGVPLVGSALITAFALCFVESSRLHVLARSAVVPVVPIVATAMSLSTAVPVGAVLALLGGVVVAGFLPGIDPGRIVPSLGPLPGTHIVGPLLVFAALTTLTPGVVVGSDSFHFAVE